MPLSPRRVGLVPLLWLAVWAACSSDDEAPAGDSGSSADPDTSTGAEGGADADPGDATPIEDTGAPDVPLPDAADLAGTEVTGLVAAYETRSPSVDALQAGGLAASFVVPGVGGPEPVDTVGDCDIIAVGPNDTLFPDVATLDAGEIRVTLGADTFVLSRQQQAGGPRYVSNAPEGRLEYFTNGLTMQVEADGGVDVGAFTGSVSAPAEPIISAPAWGQSTSGTHAVGQALIVSWPATGRGEAIISLVPIQVLPEPGLAEGHGITCRGDDTGTFTVPAAALAQLSGGGDFGPNVALTVVVPINVEVQVGGAQVTLNATASHTVVGAIR